MRLPDHAVLASIDDVVHKLTGVDPLTRDGRDVLLYEADTSGRMASLGLDSIEVFELVTAIEEVLRVEYANVEHLEEAETLRALIDAIVEPLAEP